MTHPPRRSYALCLERLEDRTVPSTLTVLNNLDSGPGSLRAVLAGAQNDDTIAFAPSLGGKTITLTSGPLNIFNPVTITGPGAASLTIDGNGSAILEVMAGATASISGLTFTHGNGAIDNGGVLTLTGDAFTANQVVNVQGVGGGAIANGGILTLSHDTFTGNTATAAPEASVRGGALWNEGQAAIDHCTFQDNAAFDGSGILNDYFSGSFGGAIANSGGKLTITTSTFTGNAAISAAGFTRAGGGAIDNDNTGLPFNDAGNPDIATASITDCTFNANLALGGSSSGFSAQGGLAEGGAIVNQGVWASMTVNACMLTNNQADGGAGGSYFTQLTPPAGIGVFGEGAGGGIANLDGAVLSVSNSQLTGNSADGGDSYRGSDATPGQGGGIFNASAVLTVADTALASNEAAGGANSSFDPGGDAAGGNATGGAIENTSGSSGVPGKLTLLHCTLITNSAVAGLGGASNLGPAGPDGLAEGGGIDDAGGTASVIGCTLIGNKAVGSAGGDGADGGQAMGGGIMVASSLALSASTLIGNTAAGGAGGQPFFTEVGNGGAGMGGGIAVAPGASATVAGSQITGNFARGGAGGTGGFTGQGTWGGIYGGMYSGGTVTLDPTVVSTPNNQTSPLPPLAMPPRVTVTNALDSGPGSLRAALASAPAFATIAFAPGLSGKTITLTSGPLAIAAGTVTINGPGAASLTIDGHNHEILQVAAGAHVAIAGITFTHGLAKAGGAINNAGTLLLTNDTFTANQAIGGQGGGAIDNTGSLTLNHDLFNANRATAAPGTDVFGGALLNTGQADIANCTFQNNQAVGGGTTSGQYDYFGGSVGGAIANSDGNLAITGSSFTNNEAVSAAGIASAAGGAIDNDDGSQPPSGDASVRPAVATAAISDCTFNSNQAIGGTGAYASGGAIVNQGIGSALTLSSDTLTDNRAAGGAAAPGADLGWRTQGFFAIGAGSCADAGGGGIANLDAASLSVSGSQLSGNVAVGGTCSLPVPNFDAPGLNLASGDGQGGAIFNCDAGAVVLDTTLANNRAQGGNNAIGLGSGAAGGAIENAGEEAGWPFGSLDVVGGTLIGNVALAGHGGTQASGLTNGLAAGGGGIDDSSPGADTVLGCSFIGNQAIGATGGTGQNGGTAQGGAIRVEDTGSTRGSLLMAACNLLGNRALGGATSSIGSQGGTAFGGGLAVVPDHTSSSTVTVTVTGSQITGNLARGGAGGSGGTAGQGLGGGTYSIDLITLDLTTAVTNNHASTSNNDKYP